MSYNGAGTFVINSAGQPVAAGTAITATAFNALTADLATLTSEMENTPAHGFTQREPATGGKNAQRTDC